MVVEQFREIKFKPTARTLIETCNTIISSFQGQGVDRLTTRQLYYQLVTQNIVTNEEKSYKKVCKLVSDARLAGLVDWDSIEDRGRQPVVWAQYDSVSDFMNQELRGYRLPRWKTQPRYVELWVEKEALAGVLRPLAAEFHATLMVNKGYSSSSAMYASASRITDGQSNTKGEEGPIVLYLGDHDASGEDMVRDIQERLTLFGVDDLDVRKIALTIEQVRRYRPPPNPAKLTDPRAANYIAIHGQRSWEVDALPPNVLQTIIRGAFDEIIDREAMDTIIAREGRHRDALRRAARRLEREDRESEENGGDDD